MRHRLTLKRPVRSADGAGGAVIAWEAVATIWGRIEVVRPQQQVVAEKVGVAITHRITLRRLVGVTTDMRFECGSRIFEIDSVWDAGKAPGHLLCLARERLTP